MNNTAIEQSVEQPLAVRILAHFFSYVFHPLFIPLYVTLFLLYVHPSYFAGYDLHDKFWLPFTVSYTSIFLPFLSVFLLKQLGFIDSIFLKTQKDRIIPYIITNIYYFWLFWIFKNQNDVPVILTSFVFGVFIVSSAALLANIYFKVSMHAIAMGGLLGLFVIILQQNTMLMALPLCIALLLAGLVCTSRLIVSDHQPKEIYFGLFLGALCQLIGAIIFL
ncbi:MAG TPA: phosphatase PAP2 family protein [Ferruginibacter sp.]|nr:phosphatase PAP2 family protein [Ferruginibacter sp.]